MFTCQVKRLSTFSLLLVSSATSLAEVRINEIMASNTRTFADITDFEDYPDWIELHNPDPNEASIGGFFLSDDPEKPYKWQIPTDATIPAGGYLLIMADGHDADIGETHRRDDWPWTADADGTGLALIKIVESSYGNNAFNWNASSPSPGNATTNTTFESWANGLSVEGDQDLDGLSNLLEYALDLDPLSPNFAPPFSLTLGHSTVFLGLTTPLDRNDIEVTLQKSTDLEN